MYIRYTQHSTLSDSTWVLSKQYFFFSSTKGFHNFTPYFSYKMCEYFLLILLGTTYYYVPMTSTHQRNDLGTSSLMIIYHRVGPPPAAITAAHRAGISRIKASNLSSVTAFRQASIIRARSTSKEQYSSPHF